MERVLDKNRPITIVCLISLARYGHMVAILGIWHCLQWQAEESSRDQWDLVCL